MSTSFPYPWVRAFGIQGSDAALALVRDVVAAFGDADVRVTEDEDTVEVFIENGDNRDQTEDRIRRALLDDPRTAPLEASGDFTLI